MRLFYVTGAYVPSRRASSVHAMRMAAAFAAGGHHVTLVTKRCAAREESGIVDVEGYYGVSASFERLALARPVWRGGGAVFAGALGAALLARRRRIDLVYSRDIVGARLAAALGLPVVFESHGVPRGGLEARSLHRLLDHRALRRLVVISDALADHLRAAGYAVPDERLLVAHDAADPWPDDGAPPPSLERPAIGYVGHLYEGRGIDVLLELARRRPGLHLHLIGGREVDVERRRSEGVPANVTLHGFVPPAEVGSWLRALDLLLMPYQRHVRVASGGETAGWMSPMKMFEYMAAGRPIVASDLPVLREVLRDGDNALLVPAEQPERWVEAVDRLLADPARADALGRRALADFQRHHTWQARSARVLDGLTS